MTDQEPSAMLQKLTSLSVYVRVLILGSADKNSFWQLFDGFVKILWQMKELPA